MGTGGYLQSSKRRFGLLALDSTVIFGTWFAVLVLSNITAEQHRSSFVSIGLWLFVSVATILGFLRRQLYQLPILPRTDEISRATSTIVIGGALLATAASFFNTNLGGWELLIGSCASSALLVILRGLFHRYQRSNVSAPARVVVVGAGEEAVELVQLIQDHPESGVELIGVVGSLSIATQHGLDKGWLGPPERLLEYMRAHQATGAIVTPTGFRGNQFRMITRTLFEAGFDVHLSTGVNRIWTGRFDVRTLSHEPLIKLSHQRTLVLERSLKRLLDIVGATIALILASPIMIAAALAIRISDRGPILFKQDRAGKDANYFHMLKFRSMVVDAEALRKDLEQQNERTGPLFKVTDDPRITRVGRFIRESSIDELPQLINVLRGDMSLVGPRPALREEETAFDTEFRDRFDVRPGITGLWQIEARSNASYNAYRRLDLHYVENWSLGLDLRILMATVVYVVVSLIAAPFGKTFSGTDTIGETTSGSVVIDLRAEQTSATSVAAGNASHGPASNAPVESGRSDILPIEPMTRASGPA